MQRLAVELAHGLSFLKSPLDIRHHHLVTHRPQELLKVHRIHVQPFFLRRDKDAINILLDGYQRPRFQIVKPVVCHQCLDSLTGTRTFLHLIKDDE